MKEPRPRKDGLCALASCRKPRKLAGLKKVYRDEAERDPFCSRPCCEQWRREQLAKVEAA